MIEKTGRPPVLPKKLEPDRASFVRYRDRLQGRDAYKRATEIDERIIEEMGLRPPQAAQAEPA